MKFSLSWLSEHIDFIPDVSLDTISKSLTGLGLEVESIKDVSLGLEDFIIAEIVNIKPHPNADRLNICDVELGDKKVSVVCGAKNVKKNLKVVFAPIGSTIPVNNMVLKKKDIRGFIGEGMLCSYEELCLEEKSDGIIELPENSPVGKKYKDWSSLSDPIFEIGLTPNRGDCASVLGIARELSAIGLGKLKENNIKKIEGTFKSSINWYIDLSDKEKYACPYVKGRYFRGLKNVESPDWLKKRLLSIGLKPISSLVDLTNYITFDIGRPLHVFDAKKLKGNLSIRMSNKSEDILALDGKKYNLEGRLLIITDENNPVSIAGVMGSEPSSCDENTTEMFLESAYFDSKYIANSGRRLNIQSDARYRFERGVDPISVDKGIDLMTQLVLEICGGQVSEEVQAGQLNTKKKSIDFEYEKLEKIGGIKIDVGKQQTILKNLGFILKHNGNYCSLSVPSWRHDIHEEVDIVEELLRVNGYDKLKDEQIKIDSYSRKRILSYEEYRNRLISSALVKRGLYEAVTFSFLSKKDAILYNLSDNFIELDNPISEELSIMRPSLLPNLLNKFVNNHNKGLKNKGLFEVGAIYLGENEEQQISCSAGIRSGQVLGRHWSSDNREVDIYDVKKDIFNILEALGLNIESVSLSTDKLPKWYHPGRAASINLGKIILGYFGELHPKYTDYYSIKFVSFELFNSKVPIITSRSYSKEFVSYNLMPIKRDFAFLTEINTPSDKIIKAIKKSVNAIRTIQLLEVNLFDVYNNNLSSNKVKSLAIEVEFQPLDKTLTDKEILEISDLIVSGVRNDTNAKLRD